MQLPDDSRMQGIPGINDYMSDDSEEVPKINVNPNQTANPMLAGYESMELNSSVNPSEYDNLSPGIAESSQKVPFLDLSPGIAESSQKLPFLEKDDSVLAPTIPESTTPQPTETPVWQNTFAASETYESSPFAIPNPPMSKETERQFDISAQNNFPFFTENPMLAGPPENSSTQTQQEFSKETESESEQLDIEMQPAEMQNTASELAIDEHPISLEMFKTPPAKETVEVAIAVKPNEMENTSSELEIDEPPISPEMLKAEKEIISFEDGPMVVARPVQITSIADGLDEKKKFKKQAKKSKLSKEKKKHKSDSRGKKKNGNPGNYGKATKTADMFNKFENPARKRKASEANLFLDMPAEKLRHMTRNIRVATKGWEQKFIKALNKYKVIGEKEKIPLQYFWLTVDPELHQAPNYYKIIQFPMDFGKILEQLKSKKYESIGEVIRDCELVFFNARIYNRPGNYVYEESKRAQKLFCSKKKSGFYKLVQSYGSENDQIAFDTRHGLGHYGPFCYDPEFDHSDPRFNNETFLSAHQPPPLSL